MRLSQVGFLFFTILTIVSFAQSLEDLPEPYGSVKITPFDGHGWYGNHSKMERLFRIYSPKVVVEVGSWLGKSTRHIASLLPEDGVVYAVDHWLGSHEHQHGNDRPIATLYDQFLSNVIHAGLTNKIIPVRMTSLEAAKTINIAPDIIYLDASHDYESVYKDISAWFPLVKGHGILCGDDWWWGTAHDAIVQYAKEHDLRQVAEGNFWYYEEQ